VQQHGQRATDNSHLYIDQLGLQHNRPITVNICCHSDALHQSTTIIQQAPSHTRNTRWEWTFLWRYPRLFSWFNSMALHSLYCHSFSWL